MCNKQDPVADLQGMELYDLSSPDGAVQLATLALLFDDLVRLGFDAAEAGRFVVELKERRLRISRGSGQPTTRTGLTRVES